MLSYQTIEPHTLELLRLLMKEPSLAETRLVGGTSLALQYGHRSSVDLDLFGQIECTSETLMRTFKQWGKVEKLSPGEKIKCFLINNVKIRVELNIIMNMQQDLKLVIQMQQETV